MQSHLLPSPVLRYSDNSCDSQYMSSFWLNLQHNWWFFPLFNIHTVPRFCLKLVGEEEIQCQGKKDMGQVKCMKRIKGTMPAQQCYKCCLQADGNPLCSGTDKHAIFHFVWILIGLIEPIFLLKISCPRGRHLLCCWPNIRSEINVMWIFV